jgi:hypothetical protein
MGEGPGVRAPTQNAPGKPGAFYCDT